MAVSHSSRSRAVFVSEALAIASAFCLALSSMFIGELKGRMSLLHPRSANSMQPTTTPSGAGRIVGVKQG